MRRGSDQSPAHFRSRQGGPRERARLDAAALDCHPSRSILTLLALTSMLACAGPATTARGTPNDAASTRDTVAAVEVTLAWPGFFTFDQDAPAPSDYAVLVAIENYDYVPSVEGATANANDWHRYFTEGLGIPPARVELLVEERATKEAIQQAIQRASANAIAGGRVWFVFIGHGAPARTGDDGLLIGSDARQTTESLEARSVRHSEVIATLEAGAATPVVVLDACFSGKIGDKDAIVPGAQPTRLADITPPQRATVVTAANAQQYAGPLPGAARPAFSYLLLGALQGWADGNEDGEVSASEAVNYVGGVLHAIDPSREQTPELAGPDRRLASGRQAGPDVAAFARQVAVGLSGVAGDGVSALAPRALGKLTMDKLRQHAPAPASEVDLDHEKALEAQFLRLEEATAAVTAAEDDARIGLDPMGEQRKAAWCALAQILEPNPHLEQARQACQELSVYAERQGGRHVQLRDQAKEIRQYLDLAHRTVAEKQRVAQDFLREYSEFSTSADYILVADRTNEIFWQAPPVREYSVEDKHSRSVTFREVSGPYVLGNFGFYGISKLITLTVAVPVETATGEPFYRFECHEYLLDEIAAATLVEGQDAGGLDYRYSAEEVQSFLDAIEELRILPGAHEAFDGRRMKGRGPDSHRVVRNSRKGFVMANEWVRGVDSTLSIALRPDYSGRDAADYCRQRAILDYTLAEVVNGVVSGRIDTTGYWSWTE